MVNYILFDDHTHAQLYPLTLTRSVADVLCGIWTIKERWSYYLQTDVQVLTTYLLQPLYGSTWLDADTVYINAAYFANTPLIESIQSLERNQILYDNKDQVIALRVAKPVANIEELGHVINQGVRVVIEDEWISRLTHVWDIFKYNDEAIRADFAALTVQQYSQKIPDYVQVIGDRDQLFIATGAIVMPCIINVTTGPVYIGEEAEVMEGCIIRGPFALNAHGVLKMGAKVYGATTIGSGSKVGGEVNNIVMFNNSNKGHDGFLGNAVIGEWCNLGADTNCSNLKNNYDEVKIWDMSAQEMVATGLQFCGLIMGDHSKCGINTMFNTGTVVGVSANIFGANFPNKYIPSFTWGGVDEHTIHQFDKALATANRMMARRNKQLSSAEEAILLSIFNNENLK